MAVLMIFGSMQPSFPYSAGLAPTTVLLGKVVDVEYHLGVKVIRFDIQLSASGRGIARANLPSWSTAPERRRTSLSITSHWNGDGRLSFLVKDLGDYTATRPIALKIGDDVTVEGPYGEFRSSRQTRGARLDWRRHQDTPFVARMNSWRQAGRQGNRSLSPDKVDESAIAARRRDVASGVTLHLVVDSRTIRLDVEKICAAVPDWRSADVWFCGPTGFGKALRKAHSL